MSTYDLAVSTHPNRRNRNGMDNGMKNSRGFTLTELMIVICMAGILIAIAAPKVLDMAARHELGGATRDVLATLRKARMTAVKENTDIAVTFNIAANSYSVFVDDGVGSADTDLNGIRDNAKNFVRDGNERIITSGIMPKHVSIFVANFGGNPSFRFDKRGFPIDMGNNFNGGNIILRDLKGEQRTVVLLMSGHSAIQ